MKPHVEPRRSERGRLEKNFGNDFYTFLVEGDPLTYQKVMTSIDATFWKAAINNEFESIIQNNTQVLSYLPLRSKAIRCKWVFKKKQKPNGRIGKYKVRLVAKGFTQRKELTTLIPILQSLGLQLLEF